jgi:NAD(P)-dependent dehydrogenase (short-subunit alcohol dehydrogenase family)
LQQDHNDREELGGAMNACTRSHIVVTGASSGIGRATALRVAAAGHHVYAGVRRPADAPAPTSANSGEITPLLLDVTDPAQISAAADTVAGHTGNAGLKGLVNNAGIGVFGPLEITPIEQFRRQLEVNVTGQLVITQALLPLLRRARGRLVLIGSIGTRFTPPFTGPVSASKSAIATMAEALRQELAPMGHRRGPDRASEHPHRGGRQVRPGRRTVAARVRSVRPRPL